MSKLNDKKFSNTGEADASFFHNKTEISLDVRPIIDKKVDPFDEIMKSLTSLKETEYLKIINYFEPIPLYSRLKQLGYEYKTKKHGMFFHIKIIRNTNLEVNDQFDENGFYQVNENIFKDILENLKKNYPEKIAFIDVSELPAPEPFTKILEVINFSSSPDLIVVDHRKMPLHLPAFLKDKNYLVSAFDKSDHFKVYVFISSLFIKYG
ncbi:MAG: DUF2249 domain-containing protein [Spirochaetia bacterium]|nr:DUF2249 domain-containing protein [Spirochaetia bacterium]